MTEKYYNTRNRPFFCQQYVLNPGPNPTYANASGIGGMITLHGMASVLNALGEPKP
jgi:hypothetical protein